MDNILMDAEDVHPLAAVSSLTSKYASGVFFNVGFCIGLSHLALVILLASPFL